MEVIKQEDQNKLLAAIEFIRSTGAKEVQIRYSDDKDPIIWIALAKYPLKNPSGINVMEVDASFSPLRAALRLCERLADGGICQHCKKQIGLEPDSLLRMPFDDVICWYQYDPELKKFRRGCE